MSNDLIHEIEESIRQERLEKLWKDYGSYLIAAIILIVLGTGLFAGWESWDRRTAESRTAQLLAALDNEKPADALDGIASGLGAGPRAIALTTAAGLLLKDGKQAEALHQYELLASDADADPTLRDLARLMAVRLTWEEGGDAVSPQDLLARLEPVWSAPDSPWRWHAREQAALILAHALNDYAAARDHLAVIMKGGDDVPPGLLQRAMALDHVYALKLSAAKTGVKQEG